MAGDQPFALGHRDPFQPTYGYGGLTAPEGAPSFMAQMAMQMAGPYIAQFSQSFAASPFGSNGQNTFDQLNRMRLTQMHDDFVSRAAQQNQINYEQQLRGVAATIGLPWGPDQQAAASQLSQTMRSMEPMFAQFAPQIMDQMSGTRGSPTVMAEHLFRGGMFRDDPLTGSRGMRQASLEQLHETLYSNMFSGGNYQDLAGMTAGQAGQLFGELQFQGRMAPSMGMRDLPDVILRDAAKRNNIDLPANLADMTSSQMAELGNDPQIGNALRAGDTSRVERTLRGYAETLSAIRDIFGENGRANAPIPELLAALDSLSGGLSQQVADPTRLANQLRTTSNLARSSGMGLQELSQFSGMTQQTALQMGLGTTAAPEAVRNALAFRTAYQSMGLGSNAGWDVADLNFQQQQISRLTLAATKSPAANMIGLTERLEAEMPGVFDPNSDAAGYLNAVRSGLGNFNRNGKSVSTAMTEPEFVRMLAESSNGRLTAGQVGSMIEQRAVNREYGERSGAATYVQQVLQGQQLRTIVGNSLTVPFNGQIVSRLKGLGIDVSNEERLELARGAEAAATESLFSMSDAERKDAPTRNAILTKALRERMGQSAAGQAILAGPDSDAFLTGLAVQGFGAADVGVRNRTNMSLLTNMSMYDPKLQARRQQEQLTAGIEGRLQQQMAGFGQGSMLQRLTQSLMDADIDDPNSVSKIIGQTLNFQPNAEAQAKLQTAGGDLQKLRAAYDAARNNHANETDPKRKADMLRNLNAAATALESGIRMVGDAGEAAGLSRAPTLTQAGAARMMRESNFLDDQLRNGGSAEAIRAAADAEQSAMGEVGRGLLGDESLRRRGGEAGKRSRRIDDIKDRLCALSASYTDGDMGKLLSGDFKHDKRYTVMEEVAALRAERRQTMEWVYSNAERGGKVSDAEFKNASDAREQLRTADRNKLNEAVGTLYGQTMSEQTVMEKLGGREAYDRLLGQDGGVDRLEYIGSAVDRYRKTRDKSWWSGGGTAAARKVREEYGDIPAEFFNLDESTDKTGMEDPRRKGLPGLLKAAGVGDETAAKDANFKLEVANLHIHRDGTAEISGRGTGLTQRGTA